MSAFAAVADPTRRTILERLRKEGPLPLKAIADRLPITRQAVTKHLRALEASGLVTSEKVGREKIHALDTEPLREVDGLAPPLRRRVGPAPGQAT